jgi:hypothetical protein
MKTENQKLIYKKNRVRDKTGEREEEMNLMKKLIRCIM